MQPLSDRDREILWMMSRGATYAQVGRKLGITDLAAKSAGRRIMMRLGAVNITQAVVMALLEGEIGRDPDCGTFAAYQRHRRRCQTADPRCLKTKARHDQEQRARVHAEKGNGS